ncbi:19195_t:CDS:2, partial [Gigaspora rosea]
MGESNVVSPYDPISMDLMAQDTIALVKHLGFKRFNFLGWSMGGRIALHVTSDIPSELELEKLIICSSSTRPSTTSYFENLYNLPKPPDPPKNILELKDEIMKIFEKIEKYFDDYMFNIQTYLINLQKYNLQLIVHLRFSVADILSKLKAIKIPTLLIHGEVDQVNLIKESEVIAREIANSKFIPIPKVGH